MNKIQHIIWDWNGTLVDDAWLFTDLINIVLKKRGLPAISLLDYKNKFCFPLEKYYKRLGFDFKKEDYNIPSLEFIKLYNENKYRPKLYSGIPALIEQLNKSSIKNYLLSAQNHDSLMDQINFYKIKHLFRTINGTNNLHARGKNLLATNLLKSKKINKNGVLFIGDTNLDMDLALQNGAKAIGITYGHQSKHRFLNSQDIFLCNCPTSLKTYLFSKFLGNQ